MHALTQFAKISNTIERAVRTVVVVGVDFEALVLGATAGPDNVRRMHSMSTPRFWGPGPFCSRVSPFGGGPFGSNGFAGRLRYCGALRTGTALTLELLAGNRANPELFTVVRHRCRRVGARASNPWAVNDALTYILDRNISWRSV